jgi:hypothetical protein
MSVARHFSPKLRPVILSGGELPGWLRKHCRIGYITSCIVSHPPWVDRAAILAMRDEAKFFTLLTGEQWVLDHVIPVNHPLVCGLSVPANFRIVPHRVNAAKGNRWYPEQLELLSDEFIFI